jgi:hypothetical protein
MQKTCQGWRFGGMGSGPGGGGGAGTITTFFRFFKSSCKEASWGIFVCCAVVPALSRLLVWLAAGRFVLPALGRAFCASQVSPNAMQQAKSIKRRGAGSMAGHLSGMNA